MTTPTQLRPTAVIDETARLLTEHYAFPETGEQLAGLLRRRLAEGAYDVDGAEELARPVTTDPQSVNSDRHLIAVSSPGVRRTFPERASAAASRCTC